MYLKKIPQRNGRIYLSIADGFYDKERVHSRTMMHLADSRRAANGWHGSGTHSTYYHPLKSLVILMS